MIDSNVEQYVREHQERVRRLDELYEMLKSAAYNDEEKNNFRQESLKLCMEGLMTVQERLRMPYWRKFTMYVIIAVSVTFGIAYLLGSLGRVINIIFSFAAGYVGMIIARRILS